MFCLNFSKLKTTQSLVLNVFFHYSPATTQSIIWLAEHKILSHPSSKIFYQRVLSPERTLREFITLLINQLIKGHSSLWLFLNRFCS